MRVLRFPGDPAGLGESRYRLRRIGRAEWLDDRADPTDEERLAADFASATEAAMFLVTYVDRPDLWIWEEFFTVGC